VSEMPPEQSGSGNPLKRKIGPLPTWAWVAIAAGIVIAWAWWRNRTQAATAAPAQDAGQVPQFVNQTYTSVVPPTPPHPPARNKKHHRRDRDHDGDDKDKQPNPHNPVGGGGGGPATFPAGPQPSRSGMMMADDGNRNG